jgi:hypothetical protein
MPVILDYEELLKYFNKHKVKYSIVGAFALAFHALPRYTKDMDVLVEASFENGKKIIAALHDFGFGSMRLAPEDFAEERQIIQLGYEPVRIDLLTSIEGCSFAEVWKNKKVGGYGRTKVNFIGLNELLKNKQAANRPQDQVDVKVIRAKIRKKKK